MLKVHFFLIKWPSTIDKPSCVTLPVKDATVNLSKALEEWAGCAPIEFHVCNPLTKKGCLSDYIANLNQEQQLRLINIYNNYNMGDFIISEMSLIGPNLMIHYDRDATEAISLVAKAAEYGFFHIEDKYFIFNKATEELESGDYPMCLIGDMSKRIVEDIIAKPDKYKAMQKDFEDLYASFCDFCADNYNLSSWDCISQTELDLANVNLLADDWDEVATRLIPDAKEYMMKYPILGD